MRGRRAVLVLILGLAVSLGCGGTAAGPAAAPSATAGAPTAAPAPPVAAVAPTAERALQVVTIGSVSPLTEAPALIAEQRGYFAAVGLKPELSRLQSGADAIPALATGQLDVGSAVTPTVALLNAVQRGLPLKVVGAAGSATPERWGSGFAVGGKQEMPLASLRAFGTPLRIAATGEGTLPNAMALLLARRDGLGQDDLTIVAMSLPDMNAALANGSVDVAATTEPFVTLGLQNGSVQRWLSYGEVLPGLPNVTVGTILYGENFLNRDRDAGERFLQAWLRGVRDWDDAVLSGRDQEAILAIVGEPTRTPPATFALLRQAGTLTLIAPDGKVETPPWAQVVDVWKSQGLIGDFDVRDLVDASFAEQAVSRLGPYQPR